MKYKLSDVVDRINGNVDRFTTSLEYYVGGEHFESNELEITGCGLIKPNVNILGFKFHFAFQPGDVLYMARNPHLRKAGMVNFSGICSDASYILRTKDSNVLCQEYLAVIMQSNHLWDYCESHKVGSVNFAINWKTLANYEFDLPDINIQRSIANRIWAAYRVKQAYKKLISATDEMVKSRFIEMFGDDKYPLIKLGDYTDLTWGDTNTTKNSYITDGYLAYSASGPDGKLDHFDYDCEGIVLSAIGADCGKTWFASGKWSCIKNTIRFWSTFDDLDNRFLYFATRGKNFWPRRGGAQPFIPQGDARNCAIPLPPICLQRKFVEIAEQADKSRFIEMFGDTHMRSNHSRQWKEVVEIINGKDYKSIQVEDGGYPVYGTGGEMARASDYLSPANSILLGRKGTIDKPLLIRKKYWNVDTAFGAVPDEKD